MTIFKNEGIIMELKAPDPDYLDTFIKKLKNIGITTEFLTQDILQCTWKTKQAGAPITYYHTEDGHPVTCSTVFHLLSNRSSFQANEYCIEKFVLPKILSDKTGTAIPPTSFYRKKKQHEKNGELTADSTVLF